MKKTLRFHIGDYVRARAYIKMEYDEKDERHATAVIEEFTGWIVGVARRKVGKYCPASGGGQNYFGESEGYEQASLDVTETLLLWKVAQSMENAPREVFDKDVELLEGALYLNKTPKKVPMRTACTEYVHEASFKQTMREEMKEWPRDEHGRWLKKRKEGL